MYGIFGEDRSDFETLRAIVRRLAGDPRLKIEGKGFGGSGNLLKHCAKQLALLHKSEFRRFIIAHDADDRSRDEVERRVESRIIKPADLAPGAVVFIAVPVRMIEAWILADIESASHIFPSWKPKEVKNPESIEHPKDEIVRMSREGRKNPLYDHTNHNAKMIDFMDLDRVAKKCPSFRALRDFVVDKPKRKRK